MTGIIDYGVGNLFSLRSSFEAIGEKAVVTSKTEELDRCERIILPGVGAFGDAAKKLRDSGLDAAVLGAAKDGKPVLGICLGMQLLFERSFEYGQHKGLSLIGGSVRPLADVLPDGFAIPHIGWNALHFTGKSELFKYVNEGDHVYFVHSFYGAECGESLSAWTEYGVKVTAAVERGRVFGTQFHPEKSGRVGLAILKAFCEVKA